MMTVSDEANSSSDDAAAKNAPNKIVVNRRAAIGTGAATVGGGLVAGALIANAARSDATPQRADTTGDIDRNLNQAQHLFKLTASDPIVYHGGTLQGANEDTFPVLRGQNGAVYFVHLDVGGVREPHWHPTAWEMNFVISGRAKWTVMGTHPDGSYRSDAFEARQGDLVFVPQGFFHYFENADTVDPLQVLIVFNTSAAEVNDDIGIVAAFNSLPRDVLAAVFDVPASTFAHIPDKVKPVVITKRQ
jgi:oxalate decarboxylase